MEADLALLLGLTVRRVDVDIGWALEDMVAVIGKDKLIFRVGRRVNSQVH